MAFLMARVWFNTFETLKAKFCTYYIDSISLNKKALARDKNIRFRKTNKIPLGGTIKSRNLIKSSFESLASRDFLRSYKPYSPKPYIKEKVLDICLRVLGTDYSESAKLSRENKFEILNICFKEINHYVPNSILHTITTAGDIIKFYETPVNTTNPYDNFKNQELPPNLHIEYDYKKYDPNDDSMFGITAFPETGNIYTGLHSKKMYKGHKPRLRPLLENDEFFTKENVFKCE